MNNNEYLQNFIKDNDYPLYISLKVIDDEELKSALITLYAFFIEIHNIHKHTTNDMASLIRLQWWHDNINQIWNDDKTQTQPTLISLFEQKKIIDHNLLLNIIENKEKEFESEHVINNFDDLKTHILGMYKPFYQSLLNIFDIEKSTLIEQAALIHGLHKIIANIEYYIKNKQNLLPQDQLKLIENNQKNHTNLYEYLIKPLQQECQQALEKLCNYINNLKKIERKKVIKILLPLKYAQEDLKSLNKNYVFFMSHKPDYRKFNYIFSIIKLLILNRF